MKTLQASQGYALYTQKKYAILLIIITINFQNYHIILLPEFETQGMVYRHDPFQNYLDDVNMVILFDSANFFNIKFVSTYGAG
jgi:hypothetical protein